MLQKANVCRCCLTAGCYKDISTEYFWSGQKEVYATMLLDTFNISISYQGGSGPSSGSRLICDGCIAELRSATSFKRRVLDSERVIVEYLQGESREDSVLEITVDPKPEPLASESSDNEDFFHDDSDFHMGDKDGEAANDDDAQKCEVMSDLDLKDEISDGAMEGFDDGGELFVIKLLPKNNSVNRIKKSTTNKIFFSKTLKEHSTAKDKKKVGKAKSKRKRPPEKRKRQKPLKTPIRELKMRENTTKLALNSTMCLFKSLKVKYQCFYCKDTYLDIRLLKEHARSHTDEKDKQMIVQRASFFKNAEITNLTCKLCPEGLTSIEALQEHLASTHDMTFHPEGHLLVPYRIEEELSCVFCQASFKTLLRLLIHMNTHYANHVCETCGASFINKTSLRIHVDSLHREKKCPFCPATFISSSRRSHHIVKMHDPSRRSVRHCHLCGQAFKYTYLLVDHRIQEHGAESQTVTCDECGKVFRNPASLRTHVRSVHLRERNYPCTHCTMRFFTSTDKRRHERTHGVADSELFSCEVCDAKFKSKDSWRRHVNKQHAAFRAS